MERYFKKMAKCMNGVNLKVDDETYSAIEGLRAIYAIVDGEEKLIVDGACAFCFEGEMFGGEFGVKVCDMNHQNRISLNRYFKYTRPQAFGNTVTTFTKEECDIIRILSLASSFKINAKPVICLDVEKMQNGDAVELQVDHISWSVFKTGYKDGYSVALNGVKSSECLKSVLNQDVSMVIADFSDLLVDWNATRDVLENRSLICILNRASDLCSQIKSYRLPIDLVCDFSCMDYECINTISNEFKKKHIMTVGSEITTDSTHGLLECLALMSESEYKIGLRVTIEKIQLIQKKISDRTYHLSLKD